MPETLINLKNESTTFTPSHNLIRLPDVLKLVPVSKSKWYLGMRSGEYPKPIKVGARLAFWREDEVIAVRDKIYEQGTL